MVIAVNPAVWLSYGGAFGLEGGLAVTVMLLIGICLLLQKNVVDIYWAGGGKMISI